MDLISQLAGNLGMDPAQAQALAGGLLGTVKEQVAQHAGPEMAAKLDAAVPELGGWQAQAASVLSGAAEAPAAEASSGLGGMLGNLASMAGSGAGNELLGALAGEGAAQQAQVVALLSKLGVDPAHASMAAGPALAFLKERMPAEWMDMALKAMPVLASLAGGDDKPAGGGGLGGMLGGLLG